MAPIRRARMAPPLRPSAPANLPQHAPDKRPRGRHQGAGPAYLRHGRRDEVGLHELDLDVGGRQFGAEGGRPLLEEGFAPAVGCQEGRGEETAEGAHGDYQPALPLHHTGSHKLRHSQRGRAIDCNDGVHFRLLCLGEGYRYGMAGSNIVDQDGNFQAVGECLELGIIVVVVGRKVHCQDFGGGVVFGPDLGCQRIELAGGAGHE